MNYIYMTINNINGKRYIGQRHPDDKYIHDPEKDPYLGSGTLLVKAVKKYGKENFTKVILSLCENQEKADELEAFYFDKYKVLENKELYYNRALPGQYNRPEEHKRLMSEKMKIFYSDPANKDRMVDGINKYRKSKGLMTLQELSEKKEKDKITKQADKTKRIEYKKTTNELRRKIQKEINALHSIHAYIYIRGYKKRYISERHYYLHKKYRVDKLKVAAQKRANDQVWRLNNAKGQYKIIHPINDYCVEHGIIRKDLPKKIRTKIERYIAGEYKKDDTRSKVHEEIMNYLFSITNN